MDELLELIRAGGWVLVPLAICSVAALTVIIERAFALRRTNVMSPRVLELLDDLDERPPDSSTLRACQRARGPCARIIESVLLGRKLAPIQAVESLHAAGRTQISSLERGLTLLEIIAGISPLLGLLGTVSGMIKVFDAISAQGMGDPSVLSAGISEALVTTVAGLSVAIPALAFHSLFSKRVDDYANEMHERAVELLTRSKDEMPEEALAESIHAAGTARLNA